MDTLALGVLISYLHHFQPEKLRFVQRNGIDVLAIVLITFPCVYNPAMYVLGYTLGLTSIGVGFGLILLRALNTTWVSTWWSEAIRYVGVYSYSIYLWHWPVSYWFGGLMAKPNFPIPVLPAVAIYILLALAVGISMSKLIEYPVLAWRDRWTNRKGEEQAHDNQAKCMPPEMVQP
jgi:peptidoglycan/LPS O-acetylase OafA/YrhL